MIVICKSYSFRDYVKIRVYFEDKTIFKDVIDLGKNSKNFLFQVCSSGQGNLELGKCSQLDHHFWI